MTLETNTKENLTHEYIEKTAKIQVSVMDKMGVHHGDKIKQEWWIGEPAKLFRSIVDNTIEGDDYSEVVDLINNDQYEEVSDLIKDIMEKKLHIHA